MLSELAYYDNITPSSHSGNLNNNSYKHTTTNNKNNNKDNVTNSLNDDCTIVNATHQVCQHNTIVNNSCSNITSSLYNDRINNISESCQSFLTHEQQQAHQSHQQQLTRPNLQTLINKLFPHLDFQVIISKSTSEHGPMFLEVYSQLLDVTVISVRGTDLGRPTDFLEVSGT